MLTAAMGHRFGPDLICAETTCDAVYVLHGPELEWCTRSPTKPRERETPGAPVHEVSDLTCDEGHLKADFWTEYHGKGKRGNQLVRFRCKECKRVKDKIFRRDRRREMRREEKQLVGEA